MTTDTGGAEQSSSERECVLREGPCFFHSSLGGPGLAPRTFSVRTEPCGLVPQRLYVGRWNGTPGPCVARVRVAIHGRCNGTDLSFLLCDWDGGGRGHCACRRACVRPRCQTHVMTVYRAYSTVPCSVDVAHLTRSLISHPSLSSLQKRTNPRVGSGGGGGRQSLAARLPRAAASSSLVGKSQNPERDGQSEKK